MKGGAEPGATGPNADAPILHVPGDEFRRILSGLAAAGFRHTDGGSESAGATDPASSEMDSIAIDRVFEAFAQAEEATGDVHIGLHAARHAPPNHVVAHLAAASPTLRDGLERLAHYQEFFFGVGTIHLRLDRRTPEVVVAPALRPDTSRHLVEYWVASLCDELLAIGGPGARPRSVRFAHMRIGDAAEYLRVLGCGARFGGETSSLRLWRAALEHPSCNASPHVASVLERVLRTRLETRDRWPLRDRVAAVLRASLAARYPVTRAGVARHLSISVRTLQRRLADDGVTFRQLYDYVRMERTLRLARDGQPVVALTNAAGFADSATLCRAFKRWTGVTTREYRSQRQAEGGSRRRPAGVPAASSRSGA